MLAVSGPVSRQIESGGAVVALESTIFSELGLPSPSNAEAFQRCVAAVRESGAVPALTAVLDGVPTVGVSDDAVDRICGPARKMAERDIGVAIGQNWPYGATTVSAALTLSAAVGVKVFATGGIGGVHRGASATGDISADLSALAHHPMVTVSAGAKVFLDLALTLEHLESISVPVIGWQCDEFPAFHAVSSGLAVPQRVDSAQELAAIANAHWAMGGGGILVVAPVPADDALELGPLEEAVESALLAASRQGVSGAGVTPLLLAALAEATGGETIGANLALAENNARIAGLIAAAISADA